MRSHPYMCKKVHGHPNHVRRNLQASASHKSAYLFTLPFLLSVRRNLQVSALYQPGYLFFSFFLLTALSLPAQVTPLDLRPGEGCSFDGLSQQEETVYGFAPGEEAETVVSAILAQIGMPQNFDIQRGNVPNAVAYVRERQRFVVYSQQFMDDIYNQTGEYWSKVAVLAHEIAHHLFGHTLAGGGSRPTDELAAESGQASSSTSWGPSSGRPS